MISSWPHSLPPLTDISTLPVKKHQPYITDHTWHLVDQQEAELKLGSNCTNKNVIVLRYQMLIFKAYRPHKLMIFGVVPLTGAGTKNHAFVTYF